MRAVALRPKRRFSRKEVFYAKSTIKNQKTVEKACIKRTLKVLFWSGCSFSGTDPAMIHG
jgi:hypothetical protein